MISILTRSTLDFNAIDNEENHGGKSTETKQIENPVRH